MASGTASSSGGGRDEGGDGSPEVRDAGKHLNAQAFNFQGLSDPGFLVFSFSGLGFRGHLDLNASI